MVSIIGPFASFFVEEKISEGKERNKINPKSQNSAETVLYCYQSRIIGGDYANHSSERITTKRVRMYM